MLALWRFIHFVPVKLGASTVLVFDVGAQTPIKAKMHNINDNDKVLLFMSSNQTGTLTIVATPIGNLNDMVPRAVQALQSASLIACRIRHSKKLLNHFSINKPCVSTMIMEIEKV